MPVPSLRQSGSLSTQIPDSFSRPEGKALVHGQNREIARGLIAGTRVQAAATVAALAVQATGMLSREANFQSDGDPAAANRVHFIVDQFANFAGNEVARFGLQ